MDGIGGRRKLTASAPNENGTTNPSEAPGGSSSRRLTFGTPAPIQSLGLASLSPANQVAFQSDGRLASALHLSEQLADSFNEHQTSRAAYLSYRDQHGATTAEAAQLQHAAAQCAARTFQLAQEVIEVREKLAKSCGDALVEASHLKVAVDAWVVAHRTSSEQTCLNTRVAKMAVRAHRLYAEAATGLRIVPNWIGGGYKLKGERRTPENLDMVAWIRADRMAGLSWEFGSEDAVFLKEVYPGLAMKQVTITIEQLIAASMSRDELQKESFKKEYPRGIGLAVHLLFDDIAMRQLHSVVRAAVSGSSEGYRNFPEPLTDLVIWYVGEPPPENRA